MIRPDSSERSKAAKWRSRSRQRSITGMAIIHHGFRQTLGDAEDLTWPRTLSSRCVGITRDHLARLRLLVLLGLWKLAFARDRMITSFAISWGRSKSVERGDLLVVSCGIGCTAPRISRSSEFSVRLREIFRCPLVDCWDRSFHVMKADISWPR